MILVNELKGKIVSKGLRQQDVAKQLDISTKTFNTKLNKGIFNSNEIEKLIEVLEIENPAEIIEIFHANKNNLNQVKPLGFHQKIICMNQRG